MAGPKEMDIRNEAFLVCAEWGPPRRTPRDQRLAECFPAVSEQEREAWLQEFKQVEDEIWKMAEEGGQSRHTRAALDTRMSARFPWMSRAALDHAWFLTGYYGWREGYDPQKV